MYSYCRIFKKNCLFTELTDFVDIRREKRNSRSKLLAMNEFCIRASVGRLVNFEYCSSVHCVECHQYYEVKLVATIKSQAVTLSRKGPAG